MDNEEIARLQARMNATTHEFLTQFTPRLENLFRGDLSLTYLQQMDDHLQLFYNDVLGELETKQTNMQRKIDELLHEANELKRQLNVDIDFDLERVDGMPLMVYQEQLDSDLKEMRERYQQKMAKIEECLREQQTLCDEMGENLRTLLTDPMASDSDIFEFENYLLDLKSERQRRLSDIEQLQLEIHVLTNEMGSPISDMEFQQLNPTIQTIQMLTNRRDQYEKERNDLKQQCHQMLDKLEGLWDCLDAPADTRSYYRNVAADGKKSSKNELENELKICKSLRQKHIKKFIEKTRIQLNEVWDKIYKSPEERGRFEFLHSDTYTEDLLTLHEMELEECTRFYNDNKKIFDLYNSRNVWWEKKKELEAKQNNPNRFNNRGGQLLKEEKERKKSDAEIPKIEREIKVLAKEFQDQNNRNFTINGECIIELIEKHWETYRNSKELLKSARKDAATPSKVPMTPKTPSHGLSTMKRMASTTNLGLTTGNLAKRRHLEVPSREVNRTASVQKMAPLSSSYMVRTHTKRNLLKQYDDSTSGFTRPIGKSVQSKRVLTSNTKGTLSNISASKILKKYRLSASRRQSAHKGIVSDESLVNYDTFENNIKTSQFSNSSVVGQIDGNQYDRENMREPMAKLSTKNNNYRSKSPLKPANFGALKSNNIIDLV